MLTQPSLIDCHSASRVNGPFLFYSQVPEQGDDTLIKQSFSLTDVPGSSATSVPLAAALAQKIKITKGGKLASGRAPTAGARGNSQPTASPKMHLVAYFSLKTIQQGLGTVAEADDSRLRDLVSSLENQSDALRASVPTAVDTGSVSNKVMNEEEKRTAAMWLLTIGAASVSTIAATAASHRSTAESSTSTSPPAASTLQNSAVATNSKSKRVKRPSPSVNSDNDTSRLSATTNDANSAPTAPIKSSIRPRPRSKPRKRPSPLIPSSSTITASPGIVPTSSSTILSAARKESPLDHLPTSSVYTRSPSMMSDDENSQRGFGIRHEDKHEGRSSGGKNGSTKRRRGPVEVRPRPPVSSRLSSRSSNINRRIAAGEERRERGMDDDEDDDVDADFDEYDLSPEHHLDQTTRAAVGVSLAAVPHRSVHRGAGNHSQAPSRPGHYLAHSVSNSRTDSVDAIEPLVTAWEERGEGETRNKRMRSSSLPCPPGASGSLFRARKRSSSLDASDNMIHELV
jgi:hypothetical protein